MLLASVIPVVFSITVGVRAQQLSCRHSTVRCDPQVTWYSFEDSAGVRYGISHSMLRQIAQLPNAPLLAGYDLGDVVVDGPAASTPAFAAGVSTNYFAVLRPRVVFGRLPEAHEFALTSSPCVTVLSAHAWTTAFARPFTTGQTANIDGKACEVLGVVDDDARTLDAIAPVDAWINFRAYSPILGRLEGDIPKTVFDEVPMFAAIARNAPRSWTEFKFAGTQTLRSGRIRLLPHENAYHPILSRTVSGIDSRAAVLAFMLLSIFAVSIIVRCSSELVRNRRVVASQIICGASKWWVMKHFALTSAPWILLPVVAAIPVQRLAADLYMQLNPLPSFGPTPAATTADWTVVLLLAISLHGVVSFVGAHLSMKSTDRAQRWGIVRFRAVAMKSSTLVSGLVGIASVCTTIGPVVGLNAALSTARALTAGILAPADWFVLGGTPVQRGASLTAIPAAVMTSTSGLDTKVMGRASQIPFSGRFSTQPMRYQSSTGVQSRRVMTALVYTDSVALHAFGLPGIQLSQGHCILASAISDSLLDTFGSRERIVSVAMPGGKQCATVDAQVAIPSIRDATGAPIAAMLASLDDAPTNAGVYVLGPEKHANADMTAELRRQIQLRQSNIEPMEKSLRGEAVRLALAKLVSLLLIVLASTAGAALGISAVFHVCYLYATLAARELALWTLLGESPMRTSTRKLSRLFGVTSLGAVVAIWVGLELLATQGNADIMLGPKIMAAAVLLTVVCTAAYLGYESGSRDLLATLRSAE